MNSSETILNSNLIARDLQHIWHPCSQMKDFEIFKPMEVMRAEGSYIHLKNGKKIVDAISSWWCKSLGHQHPRLKAALVKQANQFEHVIFSNTTNEIIVEFAERLTLLTAPLNKILFASDGSSAIEMAIKMSLHARKISGQKNKNLFFSFANSYHGETLGALSLSDLGIYRDAYADILFKERLINPVPYINHKKNILWENCQEDWQLIENALEPIAEKISAIIFEPIVQGAGGMLVYSQDFLRRLSAWAKKYEIHLIADEIMTGYGRTGKMFAYEYADISPDFLCLGKCLTAGWIPMSVMLTHENMYQLFYDDYSSGNNFLHSHTYSGNALAAAIATEVLQIYQEQNICAWVDKLGDEMHLAMQEVANKTGRLKNIRSIGAIVAADINCEEGRRAGFEVFKHAIQLGAFLRPLGNTIYWLPPLNTSIATIKELKEITIESLQRIN